jgi:hypothetical protein
MKGERMSEKMVSGPLQGLFGALLGGLISSFVVASVFGTLVGGPDDPNTVRLLVAVPIGFACAAVFMIVGLAAARRAWLGSTFLFASGFTALWSLTLSFAAQQRWAVLGALGFVIAVGVAAGWYRFGREPKTTIITEDQAQWTH